MEAHSVRTITLVEIKDLQKTLVSLHQEIQAMRARLAPLAEETDRAYQEYQAAMRPLHARLVQLDGELSRRQASGRNERQPQPGGGEKEPGAETEEESNLFPTEPADPKTSKLDQTGDIRQSQEAVHKDQLLEFLVWVSDDQTDPANLELIGVLTEMNQNQSVHLADMLECVPPDLYAVPMRGDEDNLPVWHRRLETWREALSRRLDRLQKNEAAQRSGQRYHLWQQYQQGSTVWTAFLDKQRDSCRMRIQQLEASLRELE